MMIGQVNDRPIGVQRINRLAANGVVIRDNLAAVPTFDFIVHGFIPPTFRVVIARP